LYAVAQRFNASSKNSLFQSSSFSRFDGPLEIDCQEYIERAVRHQVLYAFDKIVGSGLSGVMSKLSTGVISPSDSVCSDIAVENASVASAEIDSNVAEGYRFGGR
jgi:hypothetical protein